MAVQDERVTSFIKDIASMVRQVRGFQASFIDADERLVAVNQEVAEFWQTSPAAIEGQPVLNVLYLGEDSPLIRANRNRLPVYELLHLPELRNPNQAWIHTTAIPLYMAEQFLGTMTVGLPVTEQVRAQGIQEGLFHHPHLAIHLIDCDGLVVEANACAATWLGAGTPEKLKGRPLASFFPPGHPLLALQCLADGHIRHQTVRAPVMGDSDYIDVFATPVYDRSGSPMGVLTIARDASREVKTQDALSRAWQLHAVGELAAKTTHEFRNYLALIRCTAQMGALSARDPESAALFTQIQQQVDATNGLISELLNLSLPVERHRGPTDLAALAAQVVRVLVTQLDQGRIVLELTTPPRPALVNANERLLHQALLNVLNNSIEALRAQGGRIVVAVAHAGDLVELTIADDGPGLPAHIHDHLFEPFFTTKEGGIGLGLSVVHQIVVDFHGGELEVESPPGGGTTVHMRFPRAS